jgi:hypothetical protein
VRRAIRGVDAVVLRETAREALGAASAGAVRARFEALLPH